MRRSAFRVHTCVVDAEYAPPCALKQTRVTAHCNWRFGRQKLFEGALPHAVLGRERAAALVLLCYYKRFEPGPRELCLHPSFIAFDTVPNKSVEVKHGSSFYHYMKVSWVRSARTTSVSNRIGNRSLLREL